MAFELQVLEDAGISLIDGDRGKNYPKQVDFMDSGHCLFLSAKNVTNTGFQFENTTFISEERDNILRAGKLIRNDIVLTTRGTIGNVAFYGDSISYEHIRINSGMIIIRCDENLWNPRFLYFLFTSQVIRQQIEALTSGSAVPQLPARDLKKFKLPNIPKAIQDNIVEQVGALTDKVALNHQINQTLEQMAQALFKSWFVDFDPVIDNALASGNDIPEALQHKAEQRRQAQQLSDFKPLPDDIRALFPSEFEQTDEPSIGISGWIPKGWKKDNLKSFGKVVTGKTPPKKVENAFGSDGIPFITPTDVDSDVYALNVARRLTEDGVKVVKNNVIGKGSVCVTCIGSQMGKTVITPSKAVTNQQLNSIILSDEFSRNYIFMNLRIRREELFNLGSSGSTMPILNKSSFENLTVIRASDDILKSFSKVTENQIEKILVNSKQNKQLENIRDSLLPKLISGEVTIKREVA